MHAQIKEMFQKYINGGYGLPLTFWGGFLVGMFLGGIVNNIFGYKLGAVIMLPVTVVFCVGVWRAADKYTGEKIWRILAQVFVVLAALGFVGTVF